MTDRYAWEMTGDPWLDGMIFGAGSKKTANSIKIDVSELPAKICDDIIEKFRDCGCTAEIREEYHRFPNSSAGTIKLIIEAISPSAVFEKLPNFKGRRLIDDMIDEFIAGFFTVISRFKFTGLTHYKKDGFIIDFPMPKDDILRFLGRLGIEEYEEFPISGRLLLPPDTFLGKSPFQEIYDEHLKERELIERDKINIDDFLVEKFKEIEEKRKSVLGDNLVDHILKRIGLVKEIIGLFEIKDCSYKLNSNSFTYIYKKEIKIDDPFIRYVFLDYDVLASNWSGLENEKYIVEHIIIELLSCYNGILRDLFMKSPEYSDMERYFEYCESKYKEKSIFCFSPLELVSNTNHGDLELARFFIIKVLDGIRVDEKTENYKTPLIKIIKLHKPNSKILDSLSEFLIEFITFHTTSSCEIGHTLLPICNGCGRHFVLSSGRNCSVCMEVVCIDCVDKYFKEDIYKTREYFCKKHFCENENVEEPKESTEEVIGIRPQFKDSNISFQLGKYSDYGH